MLRSWRRGHSGFLRHFVTSCVYFVTSELSMSDIKTIGVLGAGQMGGGIAQVAAAAGVSAGGFDSFRGSIEKRKAVHKKSLAKFVEKQKISQQDADAAIGRIRFVDKIENLTGCD